MKMLCLSPSVSQLNPELLADITQTLNADGSRLLILAKPLAHRAQILSYGIQPRTKTPIEKNQLWQQLLQPQAPLTIQHGAAVYPIDCILDRPPLTPLFTAFRTAGIESLLILALGDRDRCVGCLTLFRSTAKLARLRWTADELQLAQNFGMQLYLAVMEQRVEQMFRDRLYRDLLTGLPNRLLLNQWLTLALAKMPGAGEVLAVILLNLDRFKHINDRLGHRFGDRLLQLTAERLQNTFGSEAIIGRWSGDEFALIIPTLDRLAAVNEIADRILNCFDLPFNFDRRTQSPQHSLQLKASIGIAIATTPGEDSELLLHQADAALQRAKDYGTNYEIYRAIDPPAIARLQLERILDNVCAAIADRSISDRNLLLHYQPQIDIQTGNIIGVEALLRCQDLQAKFINPNELIPIAEETGSIIQIGEWVIRTACNQNKIWQDRGWSDFPIAVNFSVKQLQDRQAIETISRILGETGLSPAALEIEITESIAIKDLDRTISILESLRNIGVKISLDDFGTGYSSLAALKYLPLDRLKIDRAFIRELRANTVDAGIVRTIVNLGHELNLNVVAEGVETIEQLEFLRSINCDAAQGFLFSQPMTALDLESAIANGSYWHPDLFEIDRESKL
jgi:diguanylate cyclase (GGDEF)-like protein